VEFGLLGGAEGPKQALRELVALPLRAPQLFARYHVAPPRGILLHGPPGVRWEQSWHRHQGLAWVWSVGRAVC